MMIFEPAIQIVDGALAEQARLPTGAADGRRPRRRSGGLLETGRRRRRPLRDRLGKAWGSFGMGAKSRPGGRPFSRPPAMN